MLQVTSQAWFTGVAALAARLTFEITVEADAGFVVQSAGTEMAMVTFAFASVTGPLLCRLPATRTLNEVPVVAVSGALTVAPDPLRSAVERTGVLLLLLLELFAAYGSIEGATTVAVAEPTN